MFLETHVSAIAQQDTCELCKGATFNRLAGFEAKLNCCTHGPCCGQVLCSRCIHCMYERYSTLCHELGFACTCM
jgi:hypothetical protein